jgi:hypothetical protein
MAQPQIHKSKRHANPMLTRNGRPRYKAFTIKQLEVELNKKPEGKKRAKLVQELNRKLANG